MHRLVERARNAEVGQKDSLIIGTEQEVGRLDVAVQQVAPVRVIQRLGYLADDGDRALRGHPPFAQLLVGVTAGHQLHGDPQLTVGLAAGVDRHDVGVIQRGGQLGLALEAPPELVVGAQLGRQHLQRVAARQRGVTGPVDGAHAALPQHTFDGVYRHHRTGTQRHAVCSVTVPPVSGTGRRCAASHHFPDPIRPQRAAIRVDALAPPRYGVSSGANCATPSPAVDCELCQPRHWSR
jgi:hypothetical protein